MTRLIGILVGLWAISAPLAAAAEPAATVDTVQVGGAFGYGVSLEDGPNPEGLGFGARIGTTAGGGLFVGAFFDFHLGESESLSAFGTAVDGSFQGHFLGAKLGYDLGAAPEFVIRPTFSTGLHLLSVEACVGSSCESDTEAEGFIAPGMELFYIGDGFYVGPEFRLNLTLADELYQTISLMFCVGAAIY